jgi:hypothetical protein
MMQIVPEADWSAYREATKLISLAFTQPAPAVSEIAVPRVELDVARKQQRERDRAEPL